MDILIFKTNLANGSLVNHIKPHIQNIPGIRKWNVDLHDVDCVLRIEAVDVSPRSIENTLQHAGYYCEELVD